MSASVKIDGGAGGNMLKKEFQQLPADMAGVLSCMEGAIILLDAGLRIVYLNEEGKDLAKLAYGTALATGDFVIDALPADRKNLLWKQLQQVLDGHTIQTEIEIAEESSTCLHGAYKPVVDGPNITGICILLKEQTMQKGSGVKKNAAERTSDECKVLFEVFMKNTPLTAWASDKNGMLHYVNPTFCDLFGVAFNNEPKSLYDIFPGHFAEECIANNNLAVEEGRMIEVIENLPKKDGNIAIYKVFKFPMQLGDQEMIGSWAIDITEDVELQEQLTDSIERYNYVNEATSDAIYDWDVATNVIYRGKGYALLFGYHNPYVPLDFRFSRIHPSDLARVKKVYEESLADPAVKKWKMEFRFKDAKGVYRTVLDKAFIIRDANKPVRVIGALQDITENKALQEKLLLGEESKKRAIVRSIIETQEKERRQLSVELHDNVNQILSSCKLMLEVAKENKDKSQALTEKSYDSLKLAIAEIRKISHDLNPSSVMDFGLKEAIDEMIENINLSGRLSIRFQFEDHAKKSLKSEDKIAVYRIVQEQLNNVLKHAKAQHVLIDVRLHQSAVDLVIEDDGIGFNPKKTNKGLGLKNIYHRVEYYHGRMDVKTAKNKGCRMEISLNITAGK